MIFMFMAMMLIMMMMMMMVLFVVIVIATRQTLHPKLALTLKPEKLVGRSGLTQGPTPELRVALDVSPKPGLQQTP